MTGQTLARLSISLIRTTLVFGFLYDLSKLTVAALCGAPSPAALSLW